MRLFCLKSLLFLLLVILTLGTPLLFLPYNDGTNGRYGYLDKHQRLESLASPKIIFVGGSNIRFGLDSQAVENQTNYNVVDMGMHAGHGLRFMLNDVKSFINKGDMVVVIPEYQHFFISPESRLFEGSLELLILVFDVYKEGKKKIELDQWFYLLRYLPEYIIQKKMSENNIYNLMKFRGKEYKKKQVVNQKTSVYTREAFNRYGDSVLHWTKKKERGFDVFTMKNEYKVNQKAVSFLLEFNDYVKAKGANLVLIYPVLQDKSFVNLSSIIHEIDALLTSETSLNILSSPEDYKYDNKYFYNTPYHLTKEGVDIRTQAIIKNLKEASLNLR